MHNIDPSELERTIDCQDNEPCPGTDPDAEEVSETTEIPEDGSVEDTTKSEEWLQVHTHDHQFTVE